VIRLPPSAATDQVTDACRHRPGLSFLAEFIFQALDHGLGLAAYHGRVQTSVQRQQLAQQVCGDAVGDQAGEAGLRAGQFRSGPLGEQPGQRAVASPAMPAPTMTTRGRAGPCDAFMAPPPKPKAEPYFWGLPSE